MPLAAQLAASWSAEGEQLLTVGLVEGDERLALRLFQVGAAASRALELPEGLTLTGPALLAPDGWYALVGLGAGGESSAWAFPLDGGAPQLLAPGRPVGWASR